MGIIQDHGHTMRNIVLCLYSLSCLVRATAQYLSYSGQAYTVFDEKTFYFMQQRNGLDFFSLDLTRSWKAAKAPLQTLPALPFEMSDAEAAPLVINNDKKSLIYFNSNWTPSVFNITTKTWRLGTHLTTHNSTMAESSDYSNYAAIDPSTGIAYIPSSFDTLLYTYNTFQGYTSNVTKAIVPAGPGLHINSAVWSTVRRSLLCYGSTGPDDDPNTWTTMEYQPSTNQWTNHKTSGGGYPGAVLLPCMESAYNGTKIVMFGTYTIPYPIFILDVKTLVWTKGAEPKPGYDRMHAACAVVGDYLIVAGGTFTSVNKQQVVVYNIKLNQWTDSYEAPQTPTTSTGMETTSPFAEQGQPSGEGMLTGAKIAIIAGASSALVILLICGAFLIRQRKMRRLSQADVLDEDLLKSNLGRMEKARNNPNYPAYPGEDMNNSTLDPSKNPQQQRTIQNEAPSEAPSPFSEGHSRIQGTRSPQNHSSKAPSPSRDGILRSHAARNPQRHLSSIQPATIQQWQCAQQRENSQYIPPPPSIPTTPTLLHYPRRNLEDHHGGYHDRSDCRAINRNQRRDHPQDDRDHHNHTVVYNATYYDRHANDPQACYRDPNDAEDYHEMYQSPRMNAPQDHGHSSTGNDLLFSNNQRRLDPQDPTRHSTASRLEFYQSRRLNNPQDHGDQDDQDDDTLYQDIQRTRAQQEEHLVQQQNLEGVRLEKEAKLHTLTGCSKHPPPQGHSGPLRPRS